MGNSLLDQLKKSGLVDDKQVKKAKKAKHDVNKQQRQSKTKTPDQDKLQAQKAQAEKVARDRELNRQQKEAADRKAIAAQIKQLIEMNRIEERDGEIAYNFSDGKKVQRIYVTEKLQQQLGSGWLAIVKLGEGYELVPAAVADKIRIRDETSVVVCNAAQRSDDKEEDNPYADYHVPDDLMW